jgi:hypothetical protein
MLLPARRALQNKGKETGSEKREKEQLGSRRDDFL